jgi:hypothetical protein
LPPNTMTYSDDILMILVLTCQEIGT